jgi:hypothetical protein
MSRRPRPHWLVIVALAACGGNDPVLWTDARPIDGAIAGGASLTFSDSGPAALVPAPARAIAVGAADSIAPGRRVCHGSMVVADDGAGGAFAAWWEERPQDRAVVLLVARRGRDGDRAWGPPVVADDRDRGRRGCDRPAPAVTADGRRGHIHLAYFLEPPDGAAVFAGHSLEDGAYFHGPVAIVYGDRPSRTAVAMGGDLVVYVYEEPNGARPRIDLAISATAGHLIEHRLRASPPGVVASAPLVALDGRRVAVAWRESSSRADSSTARAQLRLGELRVVATPAQESR